MGVGGWNRARTLALLAALAAGAAARGQAPAADDPRVLAWFDFDGEDVETGPWTVTAFEDSRGSVALSSEYRWSGWRSVEIRDVAGDGDFAELQGFFRELHEGALHFHFALMLAEPGEAMNVALAGGSHFRMVRDGIGFWLRVRDGRFLHVVAGEPQPLVPVRPFTWYAFDVVYHLEPGRYDLMLREEGREEPTLVLRDQPNAVGMPGSRLHKFSFIGDEPGIDTSNARFWVDDVLLAADRPVPAPGPFVAPGRRMLFVELHDYYRRQLYRQPGCPPTLGPEDFGIASHELLELAQRDRLELYDALADRLTREPPAEAPEALRARLEAMAVWSQGCAAPARCDAGECASDLFGAAAEAVPAARLYPMSRVLALAGEGRWPEADALLLSIYPEWERDPRFPALAATLGIARGELDEAEAWLDSAVDHLPAAPGDRVLQRLWAGELDASLLRELQAAFPQEWHPTLSTALSAEHRFYVLLWQDQPELARSWATRMITRLEALGIPAGRWRERQGDALFELGDAAGAQQSYEAALASGAPPRAVHPKLSDVCFALGDLEGERRHRERVYGSLLR